MCLGKYVSASDKVEVIVKALCGKSPRTMNELAKVLEEELGLKFSTARSAISRIVGELIEDDVLEDVGANSKGSRLIDISPTGAYIMSYILPDVKKKFISKNDLLNFLSRKNSEAAEVLEVYYVIRKKIEELEDYSFGEALTTAAEFEDIEIDNWDELAEELISLCTREIERYLDKKGGILDLREIVSKLSDKAKKVYGKILYAYLDSINEEIKKLELRKEKVQELIREVMEV